MMRNAEHRDFKELEELAIQEKLKQRYDVTISSEKGVYESDFELIIRKRPTARRKHPR
jgi:hypothetical protein